MSEKKDNTWYLPFIGGIITILALLTPAAYFDSIEFSTNIWIWGLFSVRAYDYYYGTISSTKFTVSPVEIVLSIISTLLVFGSAIGLMKKAHSYRKQERNQNDWTKLAVIMIVGVLIWVIGLEINTYAEVGVSFWQYISPGFGVIGPFLGAALTLIGYALAKKKITQVSKTVTPIMPIKPATELETPYSLKFCPTCGNKITHLDQQFCMNCGNDLRAFKIQ